ncbi:MAG TPA: phosphotransferase [Lacipirellulaceae bacterium]|nr:phosphotransferase [Lacipirellulaceae bacterium]
MRSLQVNQVLNHYPPDCQPAQVEALGSAGGMSGAQFWRITVRGSPEPTQRMLCLRRWPIEHPSPQRLAFIHAVLQHAAGGGISFIPVPIASHTGESFVLHAGYLWQLEPWMRGAADYERTPRVAKLRAAMTALAQFHIATCNFQPGATTMGVGRKAEPVPGANQSAIPRRLAQLRALSQSGISDLSRAICDTIWPELAPLARQFIAALPIAAQKAIAKLEPLVDIRLPLQPCLRDIWHDHILFIGDEVTGIIDFGAVDIDTPAADIARLLGSLVADDPAGWQTGLAAYSSVRPVSPDESLAVSAFDTCGPILAGCNWIRWIYIERRDFENCQQVIERFRKQLARVANLTTTR